MLTPKPLYRSVNGWAEVKPAKKRATCKPAKVEVKPLSKNAKRKAARYGQDTVGHAIGTRQARKACRERYQERLDRETTPSHNIPSLLGRIA